MEIVMCSFCESIVPAVNAHFLGVKNAKKYYSCTKCYNSSDDEECEAAIVLSSNEEEVSE